MKLIGLNSLEWSMINISPRYLLSPICSVPGNSHLVMIGCMWVFLHYFILWHTYSTKQSALHISHQLVAGRSKVMTLWGYWPALVSLSVRVSEFHYDTGWVPATNYFPIVPCVHSTSNRWQYSRYDSLDKGWSEARVCPGDGESEAQGRVTIVVRWQVANTSPGSVTDHKPSLRTGGQYH